MHPEKLAAFFDAHRQDGRPLVLATVFETRGSTYSKPGARMLIDANGVFQGMLSGGCLEGDLAIRAREVIETRRAQTAHYDLGADDDELWGLGVGCDGLMRIFLQPLGADDDYEPYKTITEYEAGTERAGLALIIASEAAAILPGACCLVRGEERRRFGIDAAQSAVLEPGCAVVADAGEARLDEIRLAGGRLDVLYAPIRPTPRLLVLGAGLDAEPLVRMAAELGWRVTVADHRPGYVEHNDFAAADRTLCCAAADLASRLALDDFDLAVVMSHHLASDRAYLGQLAGSRIPYIGLLGPGARRRRLLEELGDCRPALAGRVHGPAGLDLGGHGPAAIALSIVAEMQRALARSTTPIQPDQAGNSE